MGGIRKGIRQNLGRLHRINVITMNVNGGREISRPTRSVFSHGTQEKKSSWGSEKRGRSERKKRPRKKIGPLRDFRDRSRTY